VRGPVSIHAAFSLEPVSITSTQITKSTNLEDTKDGKRGSDTMGMKHRVDFGIYVFYGSINSQLASNETGTGFDDPDATKLKEALRTLFANDASSARPDGSMEVINVVWWQHDFPSGVISSAKVHGSLRDNVDTKTGQILDEGKLTLSFRKYAAEVSRECRQLAEIAGGWWVYEDETRPDEDGPVFVPMDRWMRLLAER